MITSSADDFFSLCLWVPTSHRVVFLLAVMLSHQLLVQETQTDACSCKNTYTRTIGGNGRGGFEQKPGKSPSPPSPQTHPPTPPPPSQAACLLVIARGIGSPLKRLKACVHVFKRQCYVSVCHLGASALLFSPTLAPFLSFTLSNSGLSTQPVRALACAFVSPWESSLSGKKKKLRLIIDISLTYNTQQAIEEPAGQGSCHSGAMSDGGPGSGSPSL